MKHDYAAALKITENTTRPPELEAYYNAIHHALLMMQKLQEPSEGMLHKMACAYEEERAKYLGGIAKYPANGDAFIGCMKKAMLEQAEKEL